MSGLFHGWKRSQLAYGVESGLLLRRRNPVNVHTSNLTCYSITSYPSFLQCNYDFDARKGGTTECIGRRLLVNGDNYQKVRDWRTTVDVCYLAHPIIFNRNGMEQILEGGRKLLASRPGRSNRHLRSSVCDTQVVGRLQDRRYAASVEWPDLQESQVIISRFSQPLCSQRHRHFFNPDNLDIARSYSGLRSTQTQSWCRYA